MPDAAPSLHRGLAGADWLLGTGAVLLAALFRLPYLAQSPGWDGDEGYNLDLAWQLLHGHAQAFAFSNAFVQHPPLFYALLAPLLGMFGRQLWVARLLAAAATSLAGGALVLAVAQASGRRAAVLAGLAFATVPFVVAYNRFAYTYNLLLAWTALTLLLEQQWERARGWRWLVLASVAAALGLLTDWEGIALPVFVALRAWPRRKESSQALTVGIAPALVVALAMLLVRRGDAVSDWTSTWGRLGSNPGAGSVVGGGAAGPALAAARWVVDLFQLLRAEWWWPAAVVGWFCVWPLAAQRRLLLLVLLLLLPILALREVNPFFRTAIPLFVPAAWGLGALLSAGIDAAYALAGATPAEGRWRVRLAGAACAALVMLPFGLEIGRGAGSLAGGFHLPIDWALSTDGAHAREAAETVRAARRPGEGVIASPQVTWLYDAPVADLFQAVAATGEPVAFYPANLPPARFRFNPADAHLAVVDRYWELWAASSAPVARLKSEVEGWTLLWSGGEYRIYRRLDASR